MKLQKIYFFALASIIATNLLAQGPCSGGDDSGQFGQPDSIDVVDPNTGDTIRIPVVVPRDPNEIIGPKGYDSLVKWVSVKDNLPYKILFENDPEFATAPAQKVIIYLPIDPKLNPASLRIGDFGFGNLTFTVPPNTTTYTKRLDVRDSLSVLIDVTAGLDMTNRRAFWVFESIDPATGLASTLPADAGFLPVNDSTKGNGEGYVTLTLQPLASAKTRDSVSATASIIFDINEPLGTNVETNVIDAVAPVSHVSDLPPAVDSVILITWSGRDDSLGAGVKDYALYYAKNNGPFILYREKIDSTSLPFAVERGATYGFFTLATDNVGNQEPMKIAAEATIQLVADLQCPANVNVTADAGSCTAVLPALDPRVNGVPNIAAASYVLSGATSGSGTGTVSGLTFNKGVTTVIYKLLGDTTKQCSFTVTVNGRTEICGNGLDDDCDGLVDEGCDGLTTYYRDADGDGHGNPAESTTAPAQPTGYVASSDDCNDNDNAIYPSAPELCDDKDNNCNGQTDEGFTKSTFYRDHDGDGFGDPATSILVCSTTPPQGFVTDNSDCDDTNASVHLQQTFYRDLDGDGFGDTNNPLQVCATTPPSGYVENALDCNDALVMYEDLDQDGYGSSMKVPCGGVANSRDCNDSDNAINPTATEVQDGKDNNCNGLTDEGNTGSLWFRDADGDGFGNPAVATRAAEKPEGYVGNRQDCDDGDPAIQTPKTYFRDTDGDGWGDLNNKIVVCSSAPPTGYVSNIGDCNDQDANAHSQVIFYRDADGDGYGDAGQPVMLCAGTPPTGYAANRLDCDDSNPTAHSTRTYYRDRDGDGFGNPQEKISACSATPPAGYVTNAQDCDDNQVMYRDNDRDGFGTNVMVPCNGVSNHDDCDDIRIRYVDNDGDGLGSQMKIACGGVTNSADCNDNDANLRYLKIFYRDADGDGYGNPGVKLSACALVAPAGYVGNSDDCNDADPLVHYRVTYYRDSDSDGFGDPANFVQVCSSVAPDGYVANRQDCNDNLTLYKDVDGDGFGSLMKVACGGVTNNSDCNDTDPAIHTCSAVTTTIKSSSMPPPEGAQHIVFVLGAYPNPFTQTTRLKYTLTEAAEVSIKLYDLMGRELMVLFNGRREKGDHQLNCSMRSFASGVYYCRLSVKGGGSILTHTIKLIKSH